MSRLLMCPPDYFGIEYEINPWMRVSNQSNGDRARTQWQALAQVLENEVGAKLEFQLAHDVVAIRHSNRRAKLY